MDNISLVKKLPPMLSGNELEKALTILPEYDPAIINANETVFPSDVQIISPWRSVRKVVASASRRRLRTSSVGCPYELSLPTEITAYCGIISRSQT